MCPFCSFRGGSPKGHNVTFFYRFFYCGASINLVCQIGTQLAGHLEMKNNRTNNDIKGAKRKPNIASRITFERNLSESKTSGSTSRRPCRRSCWGIGGEVLHCESEVDIRAARCRRRIQPSSLCNIPSPQPCQRWVGGGGRLQGAEPDWWWETSRRSLWSTGLLIALVGELLWEDMTSQKPTGATLIMMASVLFPFFLINLDRIA